MVPGGPAARWARLVLSSGELAVPYGDVGRRLHLAERRRRRFGLRGSYSFEEFHVDGRLASWPEGGVELEAWRNVAFDGTDVVEGASGFVRLCPTTEAPRPRLTVVRQPVTPLSTILVVASAPWQTAPSLELWSDGAPVDAIVEDRGGDYPSLGGYSRVFIMAIRPVALFPFGRALELRVDGADVMGRPYELSSDGTFVIAVPSEVVGDLSLDSWPPEGSYAGVRPARAPTAGWLAARSGGCIISR